MKVYSPAGGIGGDAGAYRHRASKVGEGRDASSDTLLASLGGRPNHPAVRRGSIQQPGRRTGLSDVAHLVQPARADRIPSCIRFAALFH